MNPHLKYLARDEETVGDIIDLCDKRRSLKKGRINNPVSMQYYSKVNKEIRQRIVSAGMVEPR